ncbi:unnamed protein product [Protopolystoma xenopodis]|uniref:Uncharacterized protein n=1 Tax=Protopolystoma xenopodis TaxID=117903 RepID=A0A3S5B3R9_9PLAT|nr:unnamed protein product [Protopolystoma xenopodis]
MSHWGDQHLRSQPKVHYLRTPELRQLQHFRLQTFRRQQEAGGEQTFGSLTPQLRPFFSSSRPETEPSLGPALLDASSDRAETAAALATKPEHPESRLWQQTAAVAMTTGGKGIQSGLSEDWQDEKAMQPPDLNGTFLSGPGWISVCSLYHFIQLICRQSWQSRDLSRFSCVSFFIIPLLLFNYFHQMLNNIICGLGHPADPETNS